MLSRLCDPLAFLYSPADGTQQLNMPTTAETPVTGRGTGVAVETPGTARSALVAGAGGGVGAGSTIPEEGDEEDRGSQLTGTGTVTGDVDEETLANSKGISYINHSTNETV